MLFVSNVQTSAAKASKAEKERIANLSDEERLKIKHEKRFSGYRIILAKHAKEFLIRQLKAPTTAKVELEPLYDSEMREILFVGTVTAENAFSAKLTKPVKLFYGRPTIDDEFTLYYYEFESDHKVLNLPLYVIFQGKKASPISDQETPRTKL